MDSLKSLFCLLIFILSAFASIDNNNNITLLGDAYIQENGLTSSSSSSSIGVGRAIYNHPIIFRESSFNSTASNFTFTTTPTSTSDSSSSPPFFTFIITSCPNIVENGFGYMGITNQISRQEEGMYIGVQFDTNHIGVDMNSVFCVTSVDSNSMGFDLKNAKRATVWVEYIDSKKMVKVWLSDTKSKPVTPILAARFDLSMHLGEFMFIGFSVSNDKGTSMEHVIENGVFSTNVPPFGSETWVMVGCSVCGPDEGYVLMLVTAFIIAAIVCRAIYKWIFPHQSAQQTTSELVDNDAPGATSSRPDISVNEEVLSEGDQERRSSNEANTDAAIDQGAIREARISKLKKEIGTLNLKIEQFDDARKMPVSKETRRGYSEKLADLKEKLKRLRDLMKEL